MTTEVSVTAIDYDNITPENVFDWLELFSFKRYGEKCFIDPKKRIGPRYPAEADEPPPDWYTHLSVPYHCFNRTCVIIDEEIYEKIKEKFKSLIVGTKQS